jgi:hypothetical protein
MDMYGNARKVSMRINPGGYMTKEDEVKRKVFVGGLPWNLPE